MNLIKILLNPGQDFRQYHDAITMIFSGLGNPYAFLTTSPGPFNYPPPVFLFLAPFGLFNLNISWYLWVFLSMVSLFVSIFLLLIISHRLSFFSLLTTIVLLWCFYFPTKFTLGMGQINLFILLFLTLTIYLYQKGLKFWAVLFLALATSIKLSPGLLVLFFIYKKDFRSLFYFCFFILLLSLLSLLIVTYNYQWLYFSRVFFAAFGMAGKDIYYNQSLIGFLTRSFSNYSLISLLYYSFIFVSLIYIRKYSHLKLWSLLICLVLIFNPLAWQHYFVLAIIPLILLPVNPLAYFLLAWNWPEAKFIPKELWSHQFFGALLLLFPYKFVWVLVIGLVFLFYILCKGGYCF